MKINIDHDTDKLNQIIWAFDFATQYKYDRESDLRKLSELALQHRLLGLSIAIAGFITNKPVRSCHVENLMKAAIQIASRDEQQGVESDEYTDITNQALHAAHVHGWDWENDNELVNYCLKATPLERSRATYAAYLNATQ